MQLDRVARFDSSSPEYTQAFQTFLAHTDQKTKALQWLDREVDGLARKQTAIDSGAGTGKLTAWLVERFASVVGLEPNPTLAAEFRQTCPTATLLPHTIVDANPPQAADFVLCSHVFYYIPRDAWEANLLHLIDWLSAGGTLAIALQNPATDCSQMVAHFLDLKFDLEDLAAIARAIPGSPYAVTQETISAHIRTPDLPTTYQVAEFILSAHPMPNPPRCTELEEYIGRFAQPDGGYRLSCHQDFLRVVRRG